MGRRRSTTLIGLVAVTLLVAGAAACAPGPVGPTPIGPHEHFSGRVNGTGNGAVVTTVCPGPTWPGRTGHPIAGQTVSVARDPRGAGDTGAYSTVFAQAQSAYDVVAINAYDTAMELPATLEVPCDGTGTITFWQCFGIVACSSGAPDTVKVSFVNIAV